MTCFFVVIYIIFCSLHLSCHALAGSACFVVSLSNAGLEVENAIVVYVVEQDDFSEVGTDDYGNVGSDDFSDIDCYASCVAICGEQ